MLNSLVGLFSTHGNALRWRIFKSLLVILLVFQVSTASAVPAGAHLKLCIGFDGHIDVSPDDCASNPSQALRLPDPIQYGEDHHGDCVDVEIGCVSSEALRPSIAEVCLSKVEIRRNDSSSATGNYALSFTHRINQTSIHNASHLNSEVFPPSDIFFLRTVILLI